MITYLQNYNKKIFLLLLCLGCCFNSYSLIEIDSIKHKILTEQEDTVIIKHYIKLIDAYAQSNADSAMIFANKAFEIAEEIDNPKYDVLINSRLGNLFFAQGNYGRAIEYYFYVLKYYETGKKPADLISPYFNIALVYSKLKNNQNSQDFYFKALAIVEDELKKDSTIGQRFPIGRIYNNIGITYHDLGKYDKALDFYHKALSISEDFNNKVALPFVYNNIGLVYQQMGDYNIALTFFEKALNFRLNTNNLEGIALTYSYFGACYALMGNDTKSLENYKKGYKIAKENQYTELQKNIAESLTEQYATINNFKKSYDMHMVYKTLSDSLDIAESTRTAIMLEQQYRFDKIQKEVELKQQQMVFRNIIIGGTLFTMLAVISLLFFLTQSKVRRIRLQRENLKLANDKLEGELDYKNKELTTNVMYLLRKNELINSISQKLLDLKSELIKSNQDPIQKIINELRRSIDDDIWKEFELRFKEVHEDFYKALNKNHPELTHNERKLCAFLRLNMSTKEISAITFQSLHSITIARSRLRKKLKITNTEINLVDFLASIE